MKPVIEKECAQHELLVALRRFLTRQRLVAHALKDLGLPLDDLAFYGTAAWGAPSPETIAPLRAYLHTTTDDREALELYYVLRRAQTNQISQTGTWYDATEQPWTYVLHGKGCQLTSLQTGEPIDWNAPHLTRFDTYFFLEHLRWQLQQPPYQAELAHLRAWVAPDAEQAVLVLLTELTEAGVITPTREIAEDSA